MRSTRLSCSISQITPKRIYVIDDEPSIARTLCFILKHHGYEAFPFFSAESALERIEQLEPDMVLSDVILTGNMDGIELAELLARTRPAVETMLLSGMGNASTSSWHLEDLEFLPEIHMKPIPPKQLLVMIDSRFAAKATGSAAASGLASARFKNRVRSVRPALPFPSAGPLPALHANGSSFGSVSSHAVGLC